MPRQPGLPGAGTRRRTHARVDESDTWLRGIRRRTMGRTVADAELPLAVGSAGRVAE